MYLLSIRYILMLSCSVVSCGKEEKALKNFSSYLIKLEKNSIVPLVYFVILYTLNFICYLLRYCTYLDIPAYCASLRLDYDCSIVM